MHKVVAYCARHLAQESHMKDEKSPEELEKTKSYKSLKNWGHDSLKKEGSGKNSNGSNGGKSKGKAKDEGESKEDNKNEDNDDEEEEGAVTGKRKRTQVCVPHDSAIKQSMV